MSFLLIGKGTVYVTSAARLAAILLLLGCWVFHWRVISAVPWPECRLSGLSINTFLSCTAGRGVLHYQYRFFS